MKKSIAALSAAAVLGLGLGVTAPATAAPYTPTVPTTGNVKAPGTVPVGKPVKLKFSAAASGNVTPSGKVIFVVKNKAGKNVAKISKSYKGGQIKASAGKLPKGKYTVKSKFVPDANSILKGDVDKASFTVK